MTTEAEEFEFRARMERERGAGGASAAPAAPSQRDVRLTEKEAPQESRLVSAMKKDPLLAQELKLARVMGKGLDWIDHSLYNVGGEVTDYAKSKGLSAETSAALGVGANVIPQIIPTGMGGGAAGALAKGAGQNMGRTLMQQALKPSRASQKSGDAANAIEYLLQKGYNVSKGGVEKLTAEIDKLDEALTKSIANTKGDVSTLRLIQPIKDAVAKFKDGLDHATNTEAIKGELLKFFDHPEVQGAFQIPAELAQRIKQATYREVGDAGYGMGLKPAAEREGKKAVARGLKESLDVVSPEAASINRQMGPAINARDLVQDRTMMAGNKMTLGLGSLVNPSHWLPWLADRSELAKSLLARTAYSGAIPEAGGAAAGAGVGAYMGRSPKDEQEKRP